MDCAVWRFLFQCTVIISIENFNYTAVFGVNGETSFAIGAVQIGHDFCKVFSRRFIIGRWEIRPSQQAINFAFHTSG